LTRLCHTYIRPCTSPLGRERGTKVRRAKGYHFTREKGERERARKALLTQEGYQLSLSLSLSLTSPCGRENESSQCSSGRAVYTQRGRVILTSSFVLAFSPSMPKRGGERAAAAVQLARPPTLPPCVEKRPAYFAAAAAAATAVVCGTCWRLRHQFAAEKVRRCLLERRRRKRSGSLSRRPWRRRRSPRAGS